MTDVVLEMVGDGPELAHSSTIEEMHGFLVDTAEVYPVISPDTHRMERIIDPEADIKLTAFADTRDGALSVGFSAPVRSIAAFDQFLQELDVDKQCDIPAKVYTWLNSMHWGTRPPLTDVHFIVSQFTGSSRLSVQSTGSTADGQTRGYNSWGSVSENMAQRIKALVLDPTGRV